MSTGNEGLDGPDPGLTEFMVQQRRPNGRRAVSGMVQ